MELREKKWPAKWPKGHKRDREAAQRQVEIAKNMELMPKWLAAAKARCRRRPRRCMLAFSGGALGLTCSLLRPGQRV